MNTSMLLTLPQEIICMIIKRCDRKTQVSWSATNDANRRFTDRLLWSEFEITYNDMDVFDRYMFKTDSQTADISIVWEFLDPTNPLVSQRPANGGIVHALAVPSTMVKPTWQAGACVKKFSARLVEHSMSEIVPERSINNTICLLLPRMPNLESCSFQGLLYTSTLREITRVRTLHTLELRTSEEYLCMNVDVDGPNDVGDYYRKSQIVGFGAHVVDFTHLHRLPYLRKLVIGRLVEGETTTLVCALASLDTLEHLEISVAHFNYRWGYYYFVPSFSVDDESPLAEFIYDLATMGPSGSHFPALLTTLVLRDCSHTFGPPIDATCLSQTIRPCRGLRTLIFDLGCGESSDACRVAVDAAALPELELLSFPQQGPCI